MERRAEDRFQVSSKIRVIVPEEPAQILDCTMADISATGIRFQSPARMESGQIVAVEVDLRLILVEVRHCETRGMKFMIGVRRLHEIDKNVQLTDPVACVREMIADLHGHISEHGAPDPGWLATQALEQIVARDGDREVSAESPRPQLVYSAPPPPPVEPVLLDAELVEQSVTAKVATNRDADIIDASPEPEEAGPAIPVAAEFFETPALEPKLNVEPMAALPVAPAVVDAHPVEAPAVEAPTVEAVPAPETIVAHESAHTTPEVPSSQAEAPAQQAPPAFDVDAEMAAEREAEMAARMKRLQEIMFAEAPPADLAPQEGSEAPAAEAAATPAVPPAEPAEPKAETASVIEMPVKGDLLEAIRSAAAETPVEEAQTAKSNSWRIPLAIAAGLILAAAIAFTMYQRRSDANANVPAQPLVEVKEAHVEPTPAPAPPPPAAKATPAPAKTAATPAAVHHAQLKWTDASWVSIVVDDGKPFQGTLQKGDTRALAFSKNATLWLGNASGVEIVLDGAKIAPMTGQVRLVELTPTGVKFPKMQAAKQAQE